MKIINVKVNVPPECNVIIGQSHFIKTVEDIHEAIVNTVPNVKFGLGFCEASGPCLVRHSGNDKILQKKAAELAFEVSAGHFFVIFIKNAYPINILNRIKDVYEVVNIFAATANPIEIILMENKEGNRGVIGVIDGSASKGIEKENDIKERKELLRKFGYKS
ncbi:hypothetical protein A3K63_00540 [Candidatus Micrarchaeota archaeon RBG_16_49_10]|nr:MAG: hypothetical protein A3K63_00540 [Candidatus Micrarchaeota archaeon RBG_16_49_10]